MNACSQKDDFGYGCMPFASFISKKMYVALTCLKLGINFEKLCHLPLWLYIIHIQTDATCLFQFWQRKTTPKYIPNNTQQLRSNDVIFIYLLRDQYRPLFQSASAQSNVRKLKHTLTSFCQYLLIDTCTVHIVYQNWDSFNLDEFHTSTEKWIDYKLISVSRWKLINKIFAIQINSCIGLCMCIRYNIFDIYMECR